MNYTEEMYKRVYEKLKSFCDKQDKIKSTGGNIELDFCDEVSKLDTQLKEKLKENNEREARLLAFINIAKAHATRLKDIGESEPYDSGVLSRLAVQINNGSHNDMHAEQLFTRASCQLRNNQEAVQEIHVWYEAQKLKAKNSLLSKQRFIEKKMTELSGEAAAYITSDEFKAFATSLKKDAEAFDGKSAGGEAAFSCDEISLGTKRVKLPIPEDAEAGIMNACKGVYDNSDNTVGVPFVINVKKGEGIFAEYLNENESEVLSGIQNFILNTFRYGCKYEQIIYIDPIRYNGSSLGILQPLSVGKNPAIDSVPLSIEEVRKKLNSLVAQINADERRIVNMEGMVMPKRLLVLHGFPQSYDSSAVSLIQQLFVNAAHYNITIIATHNMSSRNDMLSDAVSLIRTVARCIKCREEFFEVEDSFGAFSFKWYHLPEALPQAVKTKYIDEKPVLNTGNNYAERVGLDNQFTYRKGIRRLENIPYGVDVNGDILSLSFEDSNFATFICGAARSGKSTLLHTLITGLIKNNHPDDIEMWLIDFKMTEFSRYIDHLPPHVRYIILDESPELVYDIIDRLTEILIKRQNAFKGKWQKLNEVPEDRYMPAMFVIIDEFSVMSQIIADSLASSKENYSVKLQALLAKGAALGMHFIFASQGFTSGTRGLNDFSKKQVQQRIAMKTEFNEIKETLDLKSASDDDRAMMEQLPVHHALVRIPVDDRGNHLKQTKVLFIDDYTKQEALIDRIHSMVHKAPKYDVSDTGVYIDKKPMIIDGANYSTFSAKKDLMLEYLMSRRDVMERDEAVLFLGEPRRMLPIYPVTLNNGFCENVLVIAPIAEKMAASSAVMSMMQSLRFLNKEINVWTTKKNEVYRQVLVESGQKVNNVYNELADVCEQIRDIKSRIEQKIEGDRYIFLFGTETLMMDMSYQTGSGTGGAKKSSANTASTVTIEKRAPEKMDLNSMMALLSGENKPENVQPAATVQKPETPVAAEPESYESAAYDARADLKFIMTQGPRLGYHFVILFNTAGELNQCKLDVSLCKHKVLFRMAKTDVMGIISSSSAGIVSELEDHSFRYTNGIDELSFRPFLHPGLSWDGWSVSGNDAAGDDEEEYLM